MKNYNDVLNQFVNYGLLVSHVEVGRLVRCKVDGDREKRGWYIVHELVIPGKDSVLVGTYGIWRGDDNGLMKIELDKDDQLTKEQIAAVRARVTEDKKRAEAEKNRRAKAAADRAGKAWYKGCAQGHINYFDKKNVQSHGVRYTERGAAMVPMLDVHGQVHGIQFILDSKKHKDDIKKYGRNKHYWPPGLSKKGHFHLIGGTPFDVVMIVEGYSTGATTFEATGIPTIVAYDANNLVSVGKEIKKHYKGIKIIFCADDDAFSKCLNCKESVNVNDSTECPHCNKPHKKKNTGVEVAGLAAMKLGCNYIKPVFSDEIGRFDHYCKNKGKLTDFNDLQLVEGLHAVRSQIEDAITRFDLRRNAPQNAGNNKQGGGESDQLKPISSSEELLDRYCLVYGKGGMLFDQQEHMLVTLSDMRDACLSRETHRRWQESPNRAIVRPENVGFDPAGDDKEVTCNLWAGWPTTQKKGNCELALELLQYMCNVEDGGIEMYEWVLKWLAYPIQNPGAKMKSTVVVHGPQGTGKNLFFEMVMTMYGRYGRTIDQSAIEDKFNDWASGKLYLIADEVVARSDLYHVKNKLKAFITGDWIRINPKNMAAYEERNHVNLVFLSNERMPVVLEQDDRRHAVIWTPEKLSESYYKDIALEIKNGGVEALHHYLVNLPLGDFNPHQKPPMNQAKRDLIELGKDNIIRFYQDWQKRDLDGVEVMPVLSGDLYELYKAWANKQGVRAAPMNKAVDAIYKQPLVKKVRKRFLDGTKQSNPKFFIYPPNSLEMNPGNSESGWLGQCVEDFRESINEYKDSF